MAREERGRVMRRRASVAVLSALMASGAWGQEVSVYGTTMAQMWKAETPGFEKATFTPLTQFLGIDATNLGTERLSLHLFGWGRADLGEQSAYTGLDGSKAVGDLAYGYLQYRLPYANAEIKAGRFSVGSSSGIEQVDGVSARADLKGGFTVSAFGGQPVLYKNTLQTPAEKNDYEFQRNWVAGARIGLRIAKFGEFGLSYLQDGQNAAKDLPIPSSVDYTRRHMGVDLRIAPHAAVDFSGRTVFDVAKHTDVAGESPSNIAEHDYTLSVKFMDQLGMAATYTERNYRAYFAGTNLHSLFNQREKGKFNAMGASVTWGSAAKLQVVADVRQTKREAYGDATRIGADLRWAVSGLKLNTGFGFHKVSADDMALKGGTVLYGYSHSEIRAWVMHEKGKLSASLDGIFYTFDDKANPNLNGKSSLYEVVGSLGYQASANVKVSGDLSFGANPEVKKEVRGLLRAEYRFGGAAKGGKK